MIEVEISPKSIVNRSQLESGSSTFSKAQALKANGVNEAKDYEKTVGIETLGCKINTYESELISKALQSDSWGLVSSKEVADLYIINTCTVTKEADRQARQAVRRVVKRNPEALVVVMGCYAQMSPDECAAIPGVDLVIGNDRKLDVHELIPLLEKGDLPRVMVGDLDQYLSLPTDILSGYQAHTRAFVQIQQGCNQGCTFCIIHTARGPSRSLPPTLIKRQVQRLALNNCPEIVICGVDLGSYGEDFEHNDINLVLLLKELLDLEYDQANPFRIRLSSIDPVHITDELIELMASEPRLCPHLHLSLQSGSTLILKRMKRRYDANFVRERIAKLRSRVPGLVLSADVMVGFPTETQEQFEETLALVEELNIAYPHVFTYSEREGTPAARIPSNKQVPVGERKIRNKKLRELGKALERKLLQGKVGAKVQLLPEKRKSEKGYTFCRGLDYVPTLVQATDIEEGRWLQAQITQIQDGVLIAEA